MKLYRMAIGTVYSKKLYLVIETTLDYQNNAVKDVIVFQSSDGAKALKELRKLKGLDNV